MESEQKDSWSEPPRNVFDNLHGAVPKATVQADPLAKLLGTKEGLGSGLLGPCMQLPEVFPAGFGVNLFGGSGLRCVESWG